MRKNFAYLLLFSIFSIINASKSSFEVWVSNYRRIDRDLKEYEDLRTIWEGEFLTFEEWTKIHGKSYGATEGERTYRRDIWHREKAHIDTHNLKFLNGESKYFLKLNSFSDLSDEEWRRRFLMSPEFVTRSAKTRKIRDIEEPWRFEQLQINANLSTTFKDWRSEGVVGSVQDQGSCGSCWAFAGIGAAASTVAIKKGSVNGTNSSGEYMYGSVQEVLDCCPYGNATYDCWSCDGGEPVSMMGWLAEKSHGFDTKDDWPYVSNDCAGGSCYTCDESKLTDPESNVLGIDGGERPPSNNETAIMQALLTRPVSIDIDVEGDFRSYGGGIFTDEACGETIWQAVLLVGFNYSEDGSGSVDDNSYFIMQNSWGESWGDSGYMLMGMGIDAPNGVCCLACYPAIALVNDSD